MDCGIIQTSTLAGANSIDYGENKFHESAIASFSLKTSSHCLLSPLTPSLLCQWEIYAFEKEATEDFRIR
jgi:hypothetical protein